MEGFMKKILLPVDGSPRSLLAIDEVMKSFAPSVFEVILLKVEEQSRRSVSDEQSKEIHEKLSAELDGYAEKLERYEVEKRTAIGKAGPVIVDTALEVEADLILMMKSSKPNLKNAIGMTASYVFRHAPCNVMIVQEKTIQQAETYRGMVYKRAESIVNLRGQLSLKQSECLLPTVVGKCIYHIDVTRGVIRFIHRSYNPETKEWDLPPANDQQEIYEIASGETVQIPIEVEEPADKSMKVDRIRIVNRGMKTEAVFYYRIEPDEM